MALVSIVLPVYNGERFMKESSDSVLGQSFSDWELIIVDDCSTDNTYEIAKSYADADPRITVIRNNVNKRLPASLNVGFENARGKYFTWTSDDNVAKSNWLSVLVDYLDKNPDVDMVSAMMDYIDENGDLFFNPEHKRTVYALPYISNVGAAFMYRRAIAEKIGVYDESAFCAEDYDYWCRIALNGNLVYIPDNVYKYRIQANSLTMLYDKKVKEKVARVQAKYRKDFIEKFNLSYYNRMKLEYLSCGHKYKPFFVLFDIYKFLLKNTTNLFLFWNRDLRRKTYRKYRIQ